MQEVLDMQEVGGSSPPVPTSYIPTKFLIKNLSKLNLFVYFFCYDPAVRDSCSSFDEMGSD